MRTWEVVSRLDNGDSIIAVKSIKSGIPAERNAAIAPSSGDLILTCDADDNIAANWLVMMEKTPELHDVAAGSVCLTGGSLPDQCISGLHFYPYGFLPYGITANLGFSRQVFQTIGGFDETMRYRDDVDFSWSAQQAGYSIGQCEAVVYKERRTNSLKRLQQHYQFGASDVRLYVKHSNRGMRRQNRIA